MRMLSAVLLGFLIDVLGCVVAGACADAIFPDTRQTAIEKYGLQIVEPAPPSLEFQAAFFVIAITSTVAAGYVAARIATRLQILVAVLSALPITAFFFGWLVLLGGTPVWESFAWYRFLAPAMASVGAWIYLTRKRGVVNR